MKRKLILLSATLLTLSVALAACSTSDSTQSAVSDTQSSSAPSSVAVSSSSSSSSSERTYDFDSYILQYEKDNNLTDEEIQADENLKLAMFEWLRDAGVQVGLAVNDKYSGCENIFLDDYIKWCGEQEGVQEEPAADTGIIDAMESFEYEMDNFFTDENLAKYGVAPAPKAEDYIKDGKFLQEEYDADFAVWRDAASAAFDAYKKQKTQEFLDSTAEYTESVGGDAMTAEEYREHMKKVDEFSEKVAEIMQSYGQ